MNNKGKEKKKQKGDLNSLAICFLPYKNASDNIYLIGLIIVWGTLEQGWQD